MNCDRHFVLYKNTSCYVSRTECRTESFSDCKCRVACVHKNSKHIFYHLCSLATTPLHKNYSRPRSRFTSQIASSVCCCILLFKHIDGILGTIIVRNCTSPSVMPLCLLTCFVLNTCFVKYFTTGISIIIINFGRGLSYVHTFCWPCIMQWFLVNDQREAQISFYVFISIYNSLHVSSTSCSLSGETNCINTTSGNCHSVLEAVTCATTCFEHLVLIIRRDKLYQYNLW